MRTIPIPDEDQGRTLASLLRNAMPGAPRSFLRKLARDGGVVLNGAPTDPEARLQPGDLVGLRESGRVLELLAAGPAVLDILHDDADLLVLNKPAGLAVHPTDDPDAGDLATRAAVLAPALGHDGAYHVVNRLDRWTSGVVLLAPGAARAAAFARLFASREVRKHYLALVAGEPPAVGTVDLAVEDRPARTTWRRLGTGKGCGLVLVHPETGRKHQIRRHLASIGCPLVGDARYGGPAWSGVGGALLHAVSLAFVHPVAGGGMTLVAPVPRLFRQVMAAAGIPREVLAPVLAGRL